MRPAPPAPALPPRVRLAGRALALHATAHARARIAAQPVALDVELERYFSCLLRNRVDPRCPPRADVLARVPLTATVSLSFRSVMTRQCAVRDTPAAPELETMALVRTRGFAPRWVALDASGGELVGEFGY